MQMKTAGLIFLWLLAVTASAQTNPPCPACRNPVRVFEGGAAVNLTPLFQWWTSQPLFITNNPVPVATNGTNAPSANPEPARPLAAWYRITGKITASMGPSWVMNAVVYTSPTLYTNARIILNHPPAAEAAMYGALKNQLAENDRQLAAVQQIYDANTNAEAQAVERVEAYRRSWSKVAPTGVNEYSRIASKRHDTAAAALTQMDQLTAAREQINQQLIGIPAADGMYQIDCFALQLGRSKQGLMIYDVGVPARPPQ